MDIVPLYALSNLRHTAEDYRSMISRETMELETKGEGGESRIIKSPGQTVRAL